MSGRDWLGWAVFVILGAAFAEIVYAHFGPAVTAAYLGSAIGSVQWYTGRHR